MRLRTYARSAAYLAVIVGIAVLYAGCMQKSQSVLARVNNEVITPENFNERISRLPDVYKGAVGGHEKEFLDDLIVEKLLLQKAMQKGLTSDKEVIKLFSDAKNKIMIARLIDLELTQRVHVSDKEIMDYYSAHKSEFEDPVRYRASHIMVKTEDEAKQVLEKLKAGADFAEVAKTSSIDSSKDKGGDIGYFAKGDLIPEFEAAAMKMEKGDISGIVKSPLGYHIIKLTDKKDARVKDLGEVREKITQQLSDEKKKAAFDAFVKELKSSAKINVNDALVSKLYQTPKSKE